MAIRPVYLPQKEGDVFVKTVMVEFEWFPGMAVSQKQKSICSLQESAQQQLGIQRVLEVSSKSLEPLGVSLSAFNLEFTTVRPAISMTVECAFQGSKVFQQGGPYQDIFHATSREAKKDERLKNSGALTSFEFFNSTWPAEPKTAFYDWLYINALIKNPALVEQLSQYQAFTDIEFNPKKSINCQAYAVALFMALQQRGMLGVLKNRDGFLQFLEGTVIHTAQENQSIQPTLL